MNIFFYKAVNFLLLLFFISNIYGQEFPSIKNFSPEEYGGENQNWSVAQNKDKFIFVANNKGLLEYNGAKWKLYLSPNNTIIRSLKAVNNRIYSGAHMEFGFWERNDKGFLEYISLSKKINSELIEDENFWNIKAFDNWIVFQSYDRLYFYNTENQEINYFTDKNNYYRIFELNNAIYIYKRDRNLYKIEGGFEKLIAQIPKEFDVQFVLNIFTDQDNLIVLTRAKGFFKIKDGIVSKWNIPAAEGLDKYQIFSSIELQDKSFMLGTISNGIIHLSPKRELTNTINQSNGLSNNTILNLFEDFEGNVWAALDNGIDCLNMRHFIREYNDNEGRVGTTYCSIIYNDKLYVGTNQGLFYKSTFVNEPLKLVEGTKGQVWSLFSYNGYLLCGHTLGTFLIKDDKALQISTILGAWSFRTIPDHPDLLLFGHYSGMSILINENGKWKLRNKIKGFNNSARFFEIMDNNEIWVNHEYKGVYKLKINQSLTAFEKVNLFSEIPKGKGSGLEKYLGDLLYSYEDGIYKLNTLQQRFVKDTVLSKLILKDEYVSGKLVNDKNQRLWSFNKNSISYAEKGPIPGKMSIKFIPIENYWRKTTISFENITHLEKDLYIIGKTNGYILVDLSKYENKPHQIFLNEVLCKKNDTIKNMFLGEKGDFKFNHGSLQFNFSTPSYNKYELINYQYKLDGYNNTWSNWETSATNSFEKLPFGNYTFSVRSKIGNELSNNTVTYNFKIERPVYWSNYAILGYILLFLLLTILTHRLYNRYYKKQHLEIIRQNQRQLKLSRIHNEQEVIKLRIEKLNHEIESKNRELAISTMSVVKRNEVLRRLKIELRNTTNLSDTSSVFKLIDKSLHSTKDWNLFSTAFNNTDKDFLKRAKALHPELTHNDLKFCAYLRLNLTSKEIAPLLNISVKSVEVRRYRLRKKMGLPHKKNLIDYILEI